MYKLLSSPREYNELSLGFARCITTRREEYTNKKFFEGIFHLRFLTKDVCGFLVLQ